MIGGLTGVITGSLWAQMWSSGKCCFRWVRTKRSNAIVCASGSFMGTFFLFFGLQFMERNMSVAWVFIFLTITAVFLIYPVNVELYLDVVIPTRRSVASALQIVVSNLLGGAVGPSFVGIVSDAIRGSDNRPSARFNGVLKAFYVLNCVLIISGLCFSFAALFFKHDHANFRKKMGYTDASSTNDFDSSHSNNNKT